MSNLLKDRPINSKKHEQLAERWRRLIDEGEWLPGHRLPTRVEMCRQDEVSLSTVDRAFRSLENDGLVVRRQGSGTYVALTRKSANPWTGLIGYSGYGFQERPRSSYWTRLQEGIEEAADRENKAVVLLGICGPAGWDKVEGALIVGPEFGDIRATNKYLPADLPKVMLLDGGGELPCVTADDEEGGRLATAHLIALGHRRIACIMDETDRMTSRRLAGYRDVLRENGIEPRPEWVRPFTTGVDRKFLAENFKGFDEHGAATLRQWLKEDWDSLGCTALVAQNDMLAVGILDACREAGIGVPDQLSVVGFDDLEICGYVTPTLTSVAVPLRDIGFAAMDILLRRIETGRSTMATTTLPVRIHARGSTAPHHAPDSDWDLPHPVAGERS